MSGTRESAILVVIPEAEPVVGALRAEHDRSAARGVPAHVTLLYPFMPPDAIDERTRRTIAEVVAGEPAFACAFSVSDRLTDGMVALGPLPVAPFTRLIDALSRAFPAFPPYGGEFDEAIPHLTVADDGELPLPPEVLARIPFEARVEHATLMVEGDDGRWTVRERFSLGTLEPA